MLLQHVRCDQLDLRVFGLFGGQRHKGREVEARIDDLWQTLERAKGALVDARREERVGEDDVGLA